MAGAIDTASLNEAMKGLTMTFQTQIKSIIDSESGPLKRIQAQKDEINVRKGIYTDMKSNLDALQSALKAMISSEATFGLKPAPKTNIAPGLAGSTVITASVSETAAFADYNIVVSKLAKAQSRASAQVVSSDIALGKTGTFWMGGTGVADATITPSEAVSSIALGSVESGQRELGAGAYSVEVRDSNGVRQFRMVNADGQAVSIGSATGTGFTSEWQTMTNGSYDTRRGFTLQLNPGAGTGATAVQYTAKGTSIPISATDTLKTILANINAASQPEGHDFRASIVGKQLVLTASQTGANHAMIYTDGVGLGFGADLQPAQNAEFTINGMSISRASNSGLKDVVDGATINLAADAEGKSALLSIGADYGKSKTAVQSFVDKFNAALKHLTDKMAITSKTEGNKTTYTRGALTGDFVFRRLRQDLYEQINVTYSNAGSLKSLNDVGISFDKDMKLTLDSAKFEDALKNKTIDLTAILDKALTRIDKTISVYTGSTGSLQNSLKGMDDETKRIEQRINTYQNHFNSRQMTLINQYAQMQSTLAELGTQAKMFGIDLEY